MASDSIRYLTHHEIDKLRWDACIDRADNSLIYGYSFYLDALCDNWDALVFNDYEAVMPLPWRRKFTFYYLYQPFYVAALGVFGKNLSEELCLLFLKAIPTKFCYWDLDLNEENRIKKLIELSKTKSKERRNLFIKLDAYPTIYSNYSRLAKRKLTKANQEGLVIRKDMPASTVVDHYIHEYEKKKRIIPDAVYRNLKSVLEGSENKFYKTYIATTASGEVVSFYLIYTDKKFVYSIIGGSTSKGKDLGAFYLLTDAAIQDFAGTQKIFRFEGSDLSGIAFFDQQFGSYPITYLHLKRNRLPRLIRWLKN